MLEVDHNLLATLARSTFLPAGGVAFRHVSVNDRGCSSLAVAMHGPLFHVPTAVSVDMVRNMRAHSQCPNGIMHAVSDPH